jgi:hypothetical protein
VLTLQKAHIRTTIDYLNEFDNLFWEIMNEAELPASKKWQYYLISYVKKYEKTKGNQHLVIMSGGNAEAKNVLEMSPADIISPDTSSPGNYARGGPAKYLNKLVINDTDHLWGFSKPDRVDTYRRWVWMTFLRGNHPIFMDDYDSFSNGNCGQINQVFGTVRKTLGYTTNYANKFLDLAKMIPDSSICSTNYCLANKEEEYLIYYPGVESVKSHLKFLPKFIRQISKKIVKKQKHTIKIQLNIGSYTVEWFDPVNECIQKTVVVVDKFSAVEMKIPSEIINDVVIHIKKLN